MEKKAEKKGTTTMHRILKRHKVEPGATDLQGGNIRNTNRNSKFADVEFFVFYIPINQSINKITNKKENLKKATKETE